jgi:hypothetical protein
MPSATIYAHPVSYLSWDSSSSVTALTETSTTTVTNSSGGIVHWTESSNSGSLKNGNTLQCTQGAVDKTWGFSTQSSGGAQITLTVTAPGGGGAPPPKAQSQGGQGGKKKKD